MGGQQNLAGTLDGFGGFCYRIMDTFVSKMGQREPAVDLSQVETQWFRNPRGYFLCLG